MTGGSLWKCPNPDQDSILKKKKNHSSTPGGDGAGISSTSKDLRVAGVEGSITGPCNLHLIGQSGPCKSRILE